MTYHIDLCLPKVFGYYSRSMLREHQLRKSQVTLHVEFKLTLGQNILYCSLISFIPTRLHS